MASVALLLLDYNRSLLARLGVHEREHVAQAEHDFAVVHRAALQHAKRAHVRIAAQDTYNAKRRRLQVFVHNLSRAERATSAFGDEKRRARTCLPTF